MSVERNQRGFAERDVGVGVDFELTGALVARAGAREGRVVVPTDSTIADAVAAWGDRDGDHVRLALLDGDRIRSEILAVRRTDGEVERLVGSDRVHSGDTIRFEFRD